MEAKINKLSWRKHVHVQGGINNFSGTCDIKVPRNFIWSQRTYCQKGDCCLLVSIHVLQHFSPSLGYSVYLPYSAPKSKNAVSVFQIIKLLSFILEEINRWSMLFNNCAAGSIYLFKHSIQPNYVRGLTYNWMLNGFMEVSMMFEICTYMYCVFTL